MNLSKEEIEEYKEEIQELTNLLHTEWTDLKDVLSKEINMENALLCSYFEDEDEDEYGIVLTKNKQIYEFSIQEGDLEIIEMESNDGIEEEYPQIVVALTMI